MARTDLTHGGVMRLGVSSAAVPDGDLSALIEASAGRGLSALELREGDAHGVDVRAAITGGTAARTEAAAAGVMIAAYRTETPADAAALAALSAELAAPVLVCGDAALSARIEQALRVSAAGGMALVCVRGPARAWLDELARAGIAYAWEVDPAVADIAVDVDAVFGRSDADLRYIRLIGGGPEAAMQDGQGIGVLMGRLALAGYDGPVVLTPSSTRYRVAWASWLGRRGGWGCGSKAASDNVVRLATTNGGQQ